MAKLETQLEDTSVVIESDISEVTEQVLDTFELKELLEDCFWGKITPETLYKRIQYLMDDTANEIMKRDLEESA